MQRHQDWLEAFFDNNRKRPLATLCPFYSVGKWCMDGEDCPHVHANIGDIERLERGYKAGFLLDNIPKLI
jgi:hypothetical protein